MWRINEPDPFDFRWRSNTWATYENGGSNAVIYMSDTLTEVEAAELFIKEVSASNGWLVGDWKRRNIDKNPLGTNEDWAPWVTKQAAGAGNGCRTPNPQTSECECLSRTSCTGS